MKAIRTIRDLLARMPADGEVRHALRQFNMAPKAGGKVPSVKALAVKLGFDVELCDLPRGVSGRLVTDPFSENGYRIEVNRNDDRLKQRWTVLHEIAHYFLHSRGLDPFAPEPHRAGTGHFYLQHEEVQEREANAFVAALVFGDGALEAAVSLHGEDPNILSTHFGFSPLAVSIALRQIGTAPTK